MRLTLRTLIAFVVTAMMVGLAPAADTIKSGSFTRQEFKIAGSWSIAEFDGHLQLQLSDDFKTKSAPDLKIFLSRADLATLNGKNATRDALLVAPLKSAKGSQSYRIPDGVDLGEYRSIVIHCVEYSKLWGGSAL